MWIARDVDNALFLYKCKPVKGQDGYWKIEEELGFIRLEDECFPEVSYEDNEPTEVNVDITLNKQEEQNDSV